MNMASVSFIGNAGSMSLYIGGIIGLCEARNKPCIIENTVNMASVSFTGKAANSDFLYVGGIAGYLTVV